VGGFPHGPVLIGTLWVFLRFNIWRCGLRILSIWALDTLRTLASTFSFPEALRQRIYEGRRAFRLSEQEKPEAVQLG